MCQLSILVPLLRDSSDFEDTLASVLQNRPSDCEVLVIHRGMYNDPYDLSGEVRFIEVDQDAELADCLNAGLDHAAAEVVHVLLAGSTVSEDWTDAILSRFEDPRIAGAAPLLVDEEAPDRILAFGHRFTPGGRRVLHASGKRCKAAERAAAATISGPLLQAAFYRREALESLGGFAGFSDPAGIDTDIGLSFAALGLKCVAEADSQVRCQRSMVQDQACYAAGQRNERLFWGHAASRGWLATLLLHPSVIAGTWLANCHRQGGYTQLLGRLVGALDVRGHLRQAARIRRAVRLQADRGESTAASGGGEDPQSVPFPGPHNRLGRNSGRRVA